MGLPLHPHVGAGSCCHVSCMIASLPAASRHLPGLISWLWSAWPLYTICPNLFLQKQDSNTPSYSSPTPVSRHTSAPLQFHSSMLLHVLFPPSGIPSSWLSVWCVLSFSSTQFTFTEKIFLIPPRKTRCSSLCFLWVSVHTLNTFNCVSPSNLWASWGQG